MKSSFHAISLDWMYRHRHHHHHHPHHPNLCNLILFKSSQWRSSERRVAVLSISMKPFQKCIFKCQKKTAITTKQIQLSCLFHQGYVYYERTEISMWLHDKVLYQVFRKHVNQISIHWSAFSLQLCLLKIFSFFHFAASPISSVCGPQQSHAAASYHVLFSWWKITERRNPPKAIHVYV